MVHEEELTADISRCGVQPSEVWKRYYNENGKTIVVEAVVEVTDKFDMYSIIDHLKTMDYKYKVECEDSDVILLANDQEVPIQFGDLTNIVVRIRKTN